MLLWLDFAGVVMNLPRNQSILLRYNAIPKDEYFAPYFEVVGETGEMLWSFSSNSTKSERARLLYDQPTPFQAIVRVENPFFALYPAWNTDGKATTTRYIAFLNIHRCSITDQSFLKAYQCHFRLFGGLPGRFPSCEDTLYTGRICISSNFISHYS